MIYFDNAATGGFKPNAVLECAKNAITYLCANPGRASHRLSLMGAELVFDCRKKLSQMFDCKYNRVIFTKNCTESLNLAIFGIARQNDHIITTCYEHNSVLRPLFSLKNRGIISLDIVDAPICDLVQEIKQKINEKTKIIICSSVSNVNGDILPISEIGSLCQQNNITFICDGAQGGGHIPLSLSQNNINVLCLPAHKGLYGIMGLGVLIFDEKTEIEPLIYGGTGTMSFDVNQPQNYPEKLESGTVNLPAISALTEGIRFVQNNFDNFANILSINTSTIIKELKNFDANVYSSPNPAGIVAFSLNQISCDELADILNSEYDIAVRAGFHCAPLMHKHLLTDKEGLVRVSLSPYNSMREISYFLRAIKSIKNR